MATELFIPREDRDAAIEQLGTFLQSCRPGRRLKITICEARQERSDPQNHALWGVAYPPIMEHMGLRGEREKEELHEFWCGAYFGWTVYEIMGQQKKRPRRTTTTDEQGHRQVMSTVEFMEFYAFIQQKSAEYGVDVPDPDPEWFLAEKRAA